MNIKVTSDFHDGVCSVSLLGRLDSANAEETQKIILDIIKSHPDLSRLCLDMENLSYISSAGLRTLLVLKSAVPEISIVNASPAVFITMQMTGFTRIFNVQKAFRSVDVSGCTLIALGLSSRVYRLNAETVIKVYPEDTDLSQIRLEQETAQKAFVLGIPAAISYEIVRTGRQYGIAYKVSDAKCMSSLIAGQPDRLNAHAERLAALAREIHFTRIADNQFQNAREAVLSALSPLRAIIAEAQYDHISSLVSAIPDTDTLIHGSFHPNSVLFHDGRLEHIDIGSAGTGHAPLDLLGLYRLSGEDKNAPEDPECFGMTPEIRARLWHAFCHAYFGENHTPENMRVLHDYLGRLSLLKTVADNCLKYLRDRGGPVSQAPELRPGIETLMRCRPEDIRDAADRVSAFLPKP